jgi:chromosome segregation ATPase
MERLDLGQLRELARELASRRETAYAEVQAELETMKAWLRERAAAVAERERELAELSSRLGGNGLAEELAAAQRKAAAAEAEWSLAVAERERLDEREARIHEVEKELAALRIALEQKGAQTRRPPASARQRELDEREAALNEREAALDNRERMLRGDTMSFPTPLSFDDGLAGLAHNEPG